MEGDDIEYTWGFPLWECAATGKHDMAEMLLKRGVPVRAFVHTIDERSEHLRALGATSVTLGVDADNPAPFRLYQSVGFRVTSSMDAWDKVL